LAVRNAFDRGLTGGWTLQNAAYTRTGAFNLPASNRFTY
jgi:hypothetical protein